MARVFSTLHSRVVIRGGEAGPQSCGMEYLIEVDDLDEGYKMAMLGTPVFAQTLGEVWRSTIRDIREAEQMPPKDHLAP